MRYKGIIFDLDGVLCCTDQYHYEAWKQIADEISICFDKTINNRLRGISRMDSLDIILEKSEKKYTQEEKEALAEKKNNIYRQLLTRMTPEDVSQDTRDTLNTLRLRGIKLAVGSSSKNTKTILKQVGLEDFFDAVSDGTDITHSKPHPEVFLIAAKRLGLKPPQCLVVEDALAGIEAAGAGGFDSAGIGEAAAHGRVTWRIGEISDLLNLEK